MSEWGVIGVSLHATVEKISLVVLEARVLTVSRLPSSARVKRKGQGGQRFSTRVGNAAFNSDFKVDRQEEKDKHTHLA